MYSAFIRIANFGFYGNTEGRSTVSLSQLWWLWKTRERNEFLTFFPMLVFTWINEHFFRFPSWVKSLISNTYAFRLPYPWISTVSSVDANWVTSFKIFLCIHASEFVSETVIVDFSLSLLCATCTFGHAYGICYLNSSTVSSNKKILKYNFIHV